MYIYNTLGKLEATGNMLSATSNMLPSNISRCATTQLQRDGAVRLSRSYDCEDCCAHSARAIWVGLRFLSKTDRVIVYAKEQLNNEKILRLTITVEMYRAYAKGYSWLLSWPSSCWPA